MPDDFLPKLIIKLVVSFLVVVVMIIGTSYFTFNKLGEIGDTFDNVVVQTMPALLSLGQIKTNTYFLLLEVNEYVLSPDEEHVAEFRRAKENLQRALDSYENAEVGEEEVILRIRQKMSDLTSFGEAILVLVDGGASQELLLENTERLDGLGEEFIGILDGELFRDTNDLISSQKAVSNQVKDTLSKTIGFTLITLLVTIIAGFTISLSTVRVARNHRGNNKPDQELPPSR